MGNCAEVLAENWSKNISRISTKIGKQINSFNDYISAYQAIKSTWVATVSINPNKKSTGTATISFNPARNTSKANASGEEDRNSDSGQAETDMRKAKRKCLSSNFQKSISHIRDTGKHRQPPEEDDLSLYGWSDLDDQIERLVNTTHIACAKGDGNNEEGEDSDEDDLIKDVENDFDSVEQTKEPIGSNLDKIINNSFVLQ